MNSCREEVGIRRRSERPEAVVAFISAIPFVRGGPDVVAGEVHVLPAQGRKVFQQLVRDVLYVA